jgi:hypothetical protein
VLTVLLALTAASAADHYDPNAVAGASRAFAAAAEVSTAAFDAATTSAARRAAALRAYGEALDLLGDDARPEDRGRLAELRRSFARDKAVVSAFAQQQADAFDAAFRAAVARALGGRDAEVCAAAPAGPRMGPRFGAPAAADCPGDDLSAALATAIDADRVLAATLAPLVSAPWPQFSDVAEARPAVGDGPWLSAPAWFGVHGRAALRAIDLADEAARLPIEAEVEEGVDASDMPRLRAAVAEVEATTAAARATWAAPVREAVVKVAAKVGLSAPPAWCPQPADLGGCTGAPVPADVARAIAEHPKVSKALASTPAR